MIKKFGGKKISELFLNPDDESNSGLISYLNLFWEDIQKKISKKSPRLYLNEKKFKVLEDVPYKGLGKKELSKKLAEAFEGCIRWNDPRAIFNITPTPLIPAIAGSTIANLLNPNAIMDYTAGKVLNYERAVIKHLSKMAGYNQNLSGGLFVPGGKITTLHAIKIGITKCSPKSLEYGIDKKIVVIASDQSHYTLESTCNWLGIGTKSLIRIKNNKFKIDLDELEKKLEKQIKNKKKIGCIVLNAGSTTRNIVDDIKKVYEIRNRLAKKYKLDYLPHIHIDSVIGWLWLYHPDKTNISESDYKFAVKLKNEIKYADSFGVDFHKTGLSHYTSSAVIFKNKKNLDIVTRGKKFIHGDFGENFTKFISLDHSRSASPIISAWILLNYLGIAGIEDYLLHMIKLTKKIREEIERNDFLLLNKNSAGFSSVITFKVGKIDTVEKMLRMNSEEVKKYNREVKKFYNFIFSNNKKGYMEWPYLGFVLNFAKTESGQSFSALRFQTNSPFLNEKNIPLICKELGEALKLYPTKKIKKYIDFYQPK